MARRRKSKARRDVKTIANLWLPRPTALPRSGRSIAIEDRRRYAPGVKFPRRVSTRDAVVVASRPRRRHEPVSRKGTGFSFARPAGVLICGRRERRREVLAARGVLGRKNLKKGRRGPWSSIKCTRR